MHSITMMIKPVSSSCNMKCTYCFYKDESSKREIANYGLMSLDTLECIVRKAFAAADHAVCFAFQGGEPTLAPASFYEQLLKLEAKYNTRSLSITHCIQTNGLTLPNDLLNVLHKGHFLVGISLDGTKEIHDTRRLDRDDLPTFDRILETIKRLQAHHIDYNILCVVDNAIASKAEQCYQTLRKHSYLQFIACMDPIGEDESLLNPLLYGQFLIDLFQHYASDLRAGHFISIREFDNWLQMVLGYLPEECAMNGVCSTNFLIESNGDVFPCDFYALDQWKLGNISQTNFKRLENCELSKQFVQSSYVIDPKCKQCHWFSLCRGGCRRYRKNDVWGKPIGRSKLCESYQLFFESCYQQLCDLAKHFRP